MKILFLGYAVHPKTEANLSGISIAGNKMQANILYCLKREVEEVKVITVYPIAAWPREKILYIKGETRDIGEGVVTYRVPFLNIPLIKQVTQILSVYKAASQYIKKNKDTVVVCYNMYPQVGTPAVWLKHFGCKVIPILADLPIDCNYQNKGFGKRIRDAFDNQTKRNIRKADRVIVLNKNARDIYAPEKDYLVMDGGVNLSEYNAGEKIEKKKCKNIVYGGSLFEYSGVRQLIDAMDLVEDKSIELHIYGDGLLRDYAEKSSNPQVFYHGKISNQRMLQEQKKAWLLVNPRPIEDPIAQVTFPSKIFEYLMSGTPVLATRLNGFTEEYQDKMFLARDNSSRELAYWINIIAKMREEELQQVADKARRFVINERTWDVQIKKMVSFIREGI